MRHAGRHGFSLVELVTSLVILSVLLVAMGSAVVIATRALDGRDAAAAQTRTGDVMEEILRDLQFATIFTERTETTIAFSVPDRDGDGDPEVVRYTWSGEAGDPLLRSYNGSPAAVVLADVERFDLDYVSRVVEGTWVDAEGQRNLSVLMVVEKADDPSNDEQARIGLIESWGYTVSVIDDGASDSEFEALVGNYDVVYVPETVNDGSIGSALTNLPIGVVNEHKDMGKRLEIEEQNRGEYNEDEIEVIGVHYVTSGMPLDRIAIFSSNVKLVRQNQEIAPEATVLATRVGDPDEATLVIIEAGATLRTGSPAPSRRVLLPWGGDIDVTELTADGTDLLRRCVDWAAFNELVQEEEETEELLLASHDDGPGGELKDLDIKDDKWHGQYVFPLLPVNAVDWKVTRVKLQIRRERAKDALAKIEIRVPDAEGKPTLTTLDSVAFLESSLPSGDWLWIEFDMETPAISPADGVCIVVEAISGTDNPHFEVRHEQSATTEIPVAHRLETGDAGSSWSIKSGDQLQFYLYGTVTTAGAPEWP